MLSNSSVPKSASRELINFVNECTEIWNEADTAMTDLNRIFRFVWKAHTQKIYLKSSWTHGLLRFDSSWVKLELKRLKGLQRQMKNNMSRRRATGKVKELLDKFEQHRQASETENVKHIVKRVLIAFTKQLGSFIKDVEYLMKTLNHKSAEMSALTYKSEWQGLAGGLFFTLTETLLFMLTPTFQNLLELASILNTVLAGVGCLILILMLLIPIFKYLSTREWISLLRRAHLAHYNTSHVSLGEGFFQTTPRKYLAVRRTKRRCDQQCDHQLEKRSSFS